jgi:hypothetical protein
LVGVFESSKSILEQPELKDDPLEFEAAELPAVFKPDLEIQQLIKMSLENSSR